MKKTLILTAIIASFSINAQTSFMNKNNNKLNQPHWYNLFGVELLELETPYNEKFENISMFKVGTGYNLNKNIGIELSLLGPISNKKISEYQYNYYENVALNDSGNGVVYSPLTETTLRNQVKPSFVSDLSLVLRFPIHKNIDTFFNVGYAYTRMTYSVNYKRNIVTGEITPIVDNMIAMAPVTSIEDFNNFTLCQLTGALGQCGFEADPYVVNNKYNTSGISYGAGISFNYADNSSLQFKYKKYSYNNDVNVNSISATYVWKF